MNIDGSIALVTGANRGLGQAFVQGLLDAGAKKVYAAARDPNAIALREGVVPLALDITDAAQVAAAAYAAGDVNLLINNAGIAQPSPFAQAASEAAVRAQFEVNFFGTLAMARAFAPVLAAQGGGALVNVLSVLSWINLPQLGGYGASKAAAWALTNGLRNELRAQGTLVVGLHAAFIDTDMARHVESGKTSPAEVVRRTLQGVAAGREEVFADALTEQVKAGLSANAAVYLREAGR